LGNEDRRDGEHDGKDDLFDDGHAENGTTTGRLGRKKVRCKGSCYSVSYVRHEQRARNFRRHAAHSTDGHIQCVASQLPVLFDCLLNLNPRF
jgi:hypothetical protein